MSLHFFSIEFNQLESFDGLRDVWGGTLNVLHIGGNPCMRVESSMVQLCEEMTVLVGLCNLHVLKIDPHIPPWLIRQNCKHLDALPASFACVRNIPPSSAQIASRMVEAEKRRQDFDNILVREAVVKALTRYSVNEKVLNDRIHVLASEADNLRKECVQLENCYTCNLDDLYSKSNAEIEFKQVELNTLQSQIDNLKTLVSQTKNEVVCANLQHIAATCALEESKKQQQNQAGEFAHMKFEIENYYQDEIKVLTERIQSLLYDKRVSDDAHKDALAQVHTRTVQERIVHSQTEITLSELAELERVFASVTLMQSQLCEETRCVEEHKCAYEKLAEEHKRVKSEFSSAKRRWTESMNLINQAICRKTATLDRQQSDWLNDRTIYEERISSLEKEVGNLIDSTQCQTREIDQLHTLVKLKESVVCDLSEQCEDLKRADHLPDLGPELERARAVIAEKEDVIRFISAEVAAIEKGHQTKLGQALANRDQIHELEVQKIKQQLRDATKLLVTLDNKYKNETNLRTRA